MPLPPVNPIPPARESFLVEPPRGARSIIFRRVRKKGELLF
jgi:hypothetical protein